MILTVTCNPAIDVTYLVDRLDAGRVHRVRQVHARPGGKGVNVARVLHQLGAPVRALGLADATFGEGLGRQGVDATFLDVMSQVRRTLVVQAERTGETTSLWEPGAPVSATAGARLTSLVAAQLGAADALVVSGSLPPGLAPDLPVRLAELAHEAGVPAVLDLDGEPLAAALTRGGAILTPNRDEFSRLVGDPGDDLLAAATRLARHNRAPIVLTLGELGLLAVGGDTCWRVTPPRRISGNPTGAGDATAAGIALGLAHGHDWPLLLTHAVALGAAAVLSPVAGEVDLAAYEAFVPLVQARAVDSLTIGA